MKLSESVIETAKTQIGIQEVPKGSNAGPEVEIYLKSVGLNKGNAWCMAFVYWVTNESAKKLGIVNPLMKTAGVLTQWNNRPAMRVKIPQSGDVFIMDFGKGQGHTGFVSQVLPNGIIETIEGNTNTDGSREGYAVCKRTRKISSCIGFLRF